MLNNSCHMSHFFENVHLEEKKANFTVSNVDVSVVNSIRRTILSDVHTVAFYFDARRSENPDINILVNETPLHNEFLSQRLGMVPIHFESQEMANWEKDAYTFEIDQSNDGKSFKDITTEHIIVKYRGETVDGSRLFPKNSLTGDFIILTKLPPVKGDGTPTVLKVELTASKGCGKMHSCFSPTSVCTFMNRIVEGELFEIAKARYVEDNAQVGDTEQLLKQFKVIDCQREYCKNEYGEACKFDFKLESECALTPHEIFQQAIDNLIIRIGAVRERFATRDINVTSIGEETFEIKVEGESHTLGNLLQALIYNEHIRKGGGDEISFIGYNVPHPLAELVVFKLRSSLTAEGLTGFFEGALHHVESAMSKLQSEWIEISSKHNL